MIKSFEGKEPTLAETAFVAENATIIGDVRLAEGASVWFGAALRADINSISIGKNSNIQDLCVVHVDADKPVVVGENVTVGHSAVLHGCTIEDNCLVGMGAIVLDGATICEGSIVAAGALVPPGKKIGPGVLVAGVPAIKVKELGENDAELLTHHAISYSNYAKRHKNT